MSLNEILKQINQFQVFLRKLEPFQDFYHMM